MTEQEILDLIVQEITDNANNEITASVLRPVLNEITKDTRSVTGLLANLNTVANQTLVDAINEVHSLISQSGITIHTGADDPNTTPPESYVLGDFYAQMNGANVDAFFQYNGNIWAIINGLVLGETSTTAYRGDRGKIAYDHSQSTHAPLPPANDGKRYVMLDGAYVEYKDRHLDLSSISGATLNLNLTAGETFTATITENTTIAFVNPIVKVVTLDLTGDFSVTFPAGTTVKGDVYDGTVWNKVAMEYKSETDIFVTITNR